MTAVRPRPRDDRLEILTTEILRWNRQINLVSRVRTRDRVQALVDQCQVAWDLAVGTLAGDDRLARTAYIDLGSGAGLPGLVWAAARAGLNHRGPTVLVEPRDKRAWFLRRTARLMSLDAVSVQQARWGDVALEVMTEDLLISLKALRLDDAEILRGLGVPGGDIDLPREVTILRFLDPDRHSQEWLEDTFAASFETDESPWRRTCAETLGEGNPRLLLTRYRLS